jgi:hypothetical protein
MPLTWDVKNVKNAWREISEDEYVNIHQNENGKIKMFVNPTFYDEAEKKYYEMRTQINMMIFICGLHSGIPKVTKDNYKQLYNRIRFLELVQEGTYLKQVNPKTKKNEDYPFTKDMVKECIGLDTNGQQMTKPKFVKQAISLWEL